MIFHCTTFVPRHDMTSKQSRSIDRPRVCYTALAIGCQWLSCFSQYVSAPDRDPESKSSRRPLLVVHAHNAPPQQSASGRLILTHDLQHPCRSGLAWSSTNFLYPCFAITRLTAARKDFSRKVSLASFSESDSASEAKWNAGGVGSRERVIRI